MEMPKPAPAHEKLHAMIGTWTGQETMHPSPWDPEGCTATGLIEARLALDGMFVISDYREERQGKLAFRGHGVYGWDEKRGEYTMYWFDSMGSTPAGPARGKWAGDTLTFEARSALGFSRYVYRFEGDGRYAFEILMSDDGESYRPWLESSWVRQLAAEAGA